MKRELFNKWTAALRSGNYTQGHGRLRSENDTFCCLGVLCEVHDDVVRFTHPKTGDVGYVYQDAFFRGSLNPVVNLSLQEDCAPRGLNLREELGLAAGGKNIVSLHGSLMDYNDSRGYSFDQIADVLDEFVAEGVLKLVD